MTMDVVDRLGRPFSLADFTVMSGPEGGPVEMMHDTCAYVWEMTPDGTATWPSLDALLHHARAHQTHCTDN